MAPPFWPRSEGVPENYVLEIYCLDSRESLVMFNVDVGVTATSSPSKITSPVPIDISEPPADDFSR